MYLLRLATNRFSKTTIRMTAQCGSLPEASFRTFPANSQATEKLYDILEQYRQEHYRQTLPSRFVKEVLRYTDKNKDGLWSKLEFEEFLDNIGAGDQLTEGEVNEIMSHVGGEGENSDEVSIPKVQEVLLAELTAKKD